MDTKKQLTAVVASVLGQDTQLERKVMQFWEHCIVNCTSTIEDFSSHLYNGALFQEHAKAQFTELFESLIDDVPGDAFAEFWAMYPGSNATLVNMRAYIVTMPAFDLKYYTIVSNILMYELGSVATTTSNIDFYMNRFKTCTSYDIYTMTSEITAREHEKQTSNSAMLPWTPESPSLVDGVEAEAEAEAPAYDYTALRESSTQSDPHNKLHMDVVSITSFEAIFQRPMHIQEYFKYVVEKATTYSWSELLNVHNTNYNTLRAIFERYTGKSISEYYFVSKYLDDVDAIGFFDEIIDTIIASPEYHTGMCKVLATKYQNMFDQQLDENDIAYVFDSVKALKLDLVNESIIDILTNVKQETDEFISHIFKQFKRVLDRPPDMYELEEYVTYYRRSNVTQTLDGIDTTLERILMHTLEFHDIIKKQIKIVKKDILPSIMYDVLNKLIKQIDDFDMGTMDKAIATLV